MSANIIDTNLILIFAVIQQFENGPVREEYRAMVNKGEKTTSIQNVDKKIKGDGVISIVFFCWAK